MKIRPLKQLEHISILSSHQFGFRTGLSTFDALNSLTKDLYNALESRISAINEYIDFKFAFDKINHEILLRKMETELSPIHLWCSPAEVADLLERWKTTLGAAEEAPEAALRQ